MNPNFGAGGAAQTRAQGAAAAQKGGHGGSQTAHNQVLQAIVAPQPPQEASDGSRLFAQQTLSKAPAISIGRS